MLPVPQHAPHAAAEIEHPLKPADLDACTLQRLRQGVESLPTEVEEDQRIVGSGNQEPTGSRRERQAVGADTRGRVAHRGGSSCGKLLSFGWMRDEMRTARPATDNSEHRRLRFHR
jgi:hypothetical protein